jgi:hypothetical protein
MEWTAHCGCVLTCGEDGEPTDFVRRCEAHQTADPQDVAAENRAMSLARKALEDGGVDPETILTEVDAKSRIGRAHGPNGEVAEAPKVSLKEYVAQHAEASQFRKV